MYFIHIKLNPTKFCEYNKSPCHKLSKDSHSINCLYNIKHFLILLILCDNAEHHLVNGKAISKFLSSRYVNQDYGSTVVCNYLHTAVFVTTQYPLWYQCPDFTLTWVVNDWNIKRGVRYIVHWCTCTHCFRFFMSMCMRMCQSGITPNSKVHGANMGPIWVLSGPMLTPWTLLSGTRSVNLSFIAGG